MEHNPPHVLRLRSDLEFSPQQHQGKSVVVVKDPVTARYFRFSQAQASILDLLRGTDAAADSSELSSRASIKLGAAVPVATIEAFLKSVEDKWLLDTPAVREKLAGMKSQKLEDRNLLYWKLLSINPE